jgi:hypothetical protein
MHRIRGTFRLFGPSLVIGLVAPFVFPAIRRGAKPAAKGLIKGALSLGESIKEGAAVAREQFGDLLAEVKAERDMEAQELASEKNARNKEDV